MNIDDLKKSAEKITLSEDAKERIIQKCDELAKSGNIHTKSGGSDEEFTEHVFTVEHYKPRRFTKIAAGLAACALIVAGTGITMNMVKNQPKSVSSHSTAAATNTSDVQENLPEAISKVLNNDFKKFRDNYLSDYQKDKIRALFTQADYSLADEFDDADAEYIEFTDDEFTYRVGVYNDLICCRCESKDSTELATMKGYVDLKDIEGNTYTEAVTAVADEPGLKYRNYFRVSKDFSEEFRTILAMPFEELLDSDFYITTPGDLSAEQQNEIRAYLREISTVAVKRTIYSDERFEPSSAIVCLNYKNDDGEYRLNIFGDWLGYYSPTVMPDGKKATSETKYNAYGDDHAKHILEIYGVINSESETISEEDASRAKAAEEEIERLKEERNREEASRAQENQSAILGLCSMFSDDMHVGWFPYTDDVGRGVTDEVRKKLFSKLSRLSIEPGDISELEKNAEKAVVVYGSTIDNSKSLSVIIFGNQIVINSKESKDQCFKTDDEFLYEDVMALLTGDGKENLLAPFYPPAEAVYEYSGISEKAIPLETLNEIAQEINNYKWYPVSTYGSTQDALHIVVNYKNEIQDKTLHIYLKDEYIYIAERDNNANTEQQKAASVYTCNDKGLADKIKAMLEE
ncbi:hypothetical protein [uncultured Ruminococcus sp.]|uniref:hypothetical protein n=1 Tax=uncultured Ruminococcus sp. TaxID=165186 RepID=UPI00260D2188|nr:hypothetical protein [uncultured Ruminococcus sp.]